MSMQKIKVRSVAEIKPGDRVVSLTNAGPEVQPWTVEREVPKPEQGTAGTATVLFRGTLGLVSAGSRRVFLTAGVVAPGDTTSRWVDELGNLLSDEQVTDFVPDAPDATQWVPMATAEKTEVEASRLRGRLNLRTVERDQMKERWEGVKMELALAQADLSDAQDAYEAAYRSAAPDLDMEDRTEPLAVVVERLRKAAVLPTRDDLARVMHDDYLPNGEPRLGRTHREILADAVLAHLRGESR